VQALYLVGAATQSQLCPPGAERVCGQPEARDFLQQVALVDERAVEFGIARGAEEGQLGFDSRSDPLSDADRYRAILVPSLSGSAGSASRTS
jgi:limonene-1,2-epoxide hydrolase